eukprot:5187590-Pleurochrysis_carterae.AAC.1
MRAASSVAAAAAIASQLWNWRCCSRSDPVLCTACRVAQQAALHAAHDEQRGPSQQGRQHQKKAVQVALLRFSTLVLAKRYQHQPSWPSTAH